MTEKEAIDVLLENVPKCCKMVDGRYQGGFDDWDCSMGQAIKVAVLALQDIRPYRAIGTVEECRAAVEKQKPKKIEYEGSSTQDGFTHYRMGKCPDCDRWYRNTDDIIYCSGCGQALDWSEEE